jgi:predicted CXXCH cytochrome family protein
MTLVCVAVAVGAIVTAPLLVWRWQVRRSIAAILALTIAGGATLGGLLIGPLRSPKPDPALIEALPRSSTDGGFATSASCRSCHPQEYASWHASYHRRMTQPATPDAVQASFNGQVIEIGGEAVRLTRRQNEFWVELLGAVDPNGTARPTLRETRIVMTTGSHHMQGFWVARGRGKWLDQLPLMWLVAGDGKAGRWIPAADSFLGPPGGQASFTSQWNKSCIYCHSVHGQPRIDPITKAADTEIAELGIACEACHGPGAAHIEAHRRSGRTALASGPEPSPPDSTIVHPARLSPQRSSEVCGQCHCVSTIPHEVKEEDYRYWGSRYRAGDELQEHSLTLSPSVLSPEQLTSWKQDAMFWESNFWPDGMVRVAGREYNGLVESACYQRGEMTCLSCHSMHHSEPNDQLSAGSDTNDACYQCHASYRDGLERHTHHAPGSTGSLCYNCHMPHTTYGLFKAIRSHQITSPNLATTMATGRPNACNLCHLDQTLAWTGEKLLQWYGHEPAALDDDQREIAAGLLWLLKGDAVVRALVAWSFGWPTARQTSREEWSPPLLAPLLDDPYSAVRYIAGRSLDKLGYDCGYDFLAPRKDRQSAVHETLARWETRSIVSPNEIGRRLLFDDKGRPMFDEIQRLLRQRDDHLVGIRE